MQLLRSMLHNGIGIAVSISHMVLALVVPPTVSAETLSVLSPAVAQECTRSGGAVVDTSRPDSPQHVQRRLLRDVLATRRLSVLAIDECHTVDKQSMQSYAESLAHVGVVADRRDASAGGPRGARVARGAYACTPRSRACPPCACPPCSCLRTRTLTFAPPGHPRPPRATPGAPQGTPGHRASPRSRDPIHAYI